MAHNQSFQYIKDPFLFGKPNVVCRLSDVVMLFAPAVLVFNVSKFLRFAVSEFQSFTASLFQSFIAPAVLFQSFKVSLLRCFRVSSHLRCCFKVPGFSASLFQSFIAPAVLFQSSRFLRFAVSEFQSFTASLFQSFIAAPLFPKSKPRLRLFAFKSVSPEQTKILSVCYGEKRRYELLSMIEQSDIIRAISLPNATSSVNTTLLSNATILSSLYRINRSAMVDIQLSIAEELIRAISWEHHFFTTGCGSLFRSDSDSETCIKGSRLAFKHIIGQ